MKFSQCIVLVHFLSVKGYHQQIDHVKYFAAKYLLALPLLTAFQKGQIYPNMYDSLKWCLHLYLGFLSELKI